MRSLDTTGILKVLDKHGPTWNTEDGVANVTDRHPKFQGVSQDASCLFAAPWGTCHCIHVFHQDAVPEAARDVAEFVDSEKIDVLVSTFLTSIVARL